MLAGIDELLQLEPNLTEHVPKPLDPVSKRCRAYERSASRKLIARPIDELLVEHGEERLEVVGVERVIGALKHRAAATR